MVIATLAVVAVVVLVARGRGGELSAERNDYLELDLGPVSATDVALLRPPMTLWGYNMQATDEAMERIAASIKERDVRIVALEQLVTDLTREPAASPLSSPYAAPRHRRQQADPVSPFESAQPSEPGRPYNPASTYDRAQPYDSATTYESPQPYDSASTYESPQPYDSAPTYESPQPYDPAPAYEAAQPFQPTQPFRPAPPFPSAPPFPPAAPPEQSHD
jgi:hypothetical protein